MAEALEQRIDILSTKLHKPTLPDTAGDLASDMPPLHPSTAPSSPTLILPSYLRTVMSKGGRETSQDLVDVQTNPLLLSTYLQDGEMLPLRPSWELQNPNLRTHTESQPQGRAWQWVSCLWSYLWAWSNGAPVSVLFGEQGGCCPDSEGGDDS